MTRISIDYRVLFITNNMHNSKNNTSRYIHKPNYATNKYNIDLTMLTHIR